MGRVPGGVGSSAMHGTDNHEAICNSPLLIKIPHTRLRLSAETLQLAAMAADAVIVIGAMVFSYGVYHSEFRLFNDVFWKAFNIGTCAALFYAAYFYYYGGYDASALSSPRRQLRGVFNSWIFVFFILAWLAFLLKITASFSRAGVTIFFFTGFGALAMAHMAGASWVRFGLRRRKLSLRRVHVIGILNEQAQERVGERLLDCGIETVGFTPIPPGAVSRAETFIGACRHAAAAVKKTLAHTPIAAVYLFLPWRNREHIEEVRLALSHTPVPVVLFADEELERVLSAPRVNPGDLYGFEIHRAPLTLKDRLKKRALDIVVAGGALLLLAPLFLLTALAILAESGRPVIFRQDRKGFGGRPFRIYKFRSMKVLENGPEIRQATKGDERVTRLGRFMRRFNIDELPQIVNVLRGEMSVCGPRPHALAHDNFYDRLIETYAGRHRVKPGITGWAQVNGFRGETREISQMEGRVQHDMWYIDNWSLWLDLRIIFMTAGKILFDRQAY
jgi:Undecaprenyl-phosphate glucose phosphotransferase